MSEKSSSLTVPKLLALLLLTVVATAAVVYLVLRPSEKPGEVVVTKFEPEAAAKLKINTLQAEEATPKGGEKPVVGRRYKVRIDSESREGTEGIARIGGLVVFVKEGRPGQDVVIEITRVRSTTAEGVIVKTETGPAPVAVAPPAPVAPPVESAIYTGTVVSVGKYGDGVVKLNNEPVYIPGVQKGDRISYALNERRGKYANGRLIAKLSSESAGGEAKTTTSASNRTVEVRAPQIQAGQELEVEITEKDRNNPDKAGVGRIENLVILVPETKPGDRVKVRITDRRATLAHAEIIQRLESAPANP